MPTEEYQYHAKPPITLKARAPIDDEKEYQYHVEPPINDKKEYQYRGKKPPITLKALGPAQKYDDTYDKKEKIMRKLKPQKKHDLEYPPIDATENSDVSENPSKRRRLQGPTPLENPAERLVYTENHPPPPCPGDPWDKWNRWLPLDCFYSHCVKRDGSDVMRNTMKSILIATKEAKMNIMMIANGSLIFASMVTPQEEVIRRHPEALSTYEGTFRYNPFVYDGHRDPHMKNARTLAKVSLRVRTNPPTISVDWFAKDMEMPTGKNAVGGPLTPHKSSKPARMLLCASLMVARCKLLWDMNIDPTKVEDWKVPTIGVRLLAAGNSDLVRYYQETLGLVSSSGKTEYPYNTHMEGSLNDALKLCHIASALPQSLLPLLHSVTLQPRAPALARPLLLAQGF